MAKDAALGIEISATKLLLRCNAIVLKQFTKTVGTSLEGPNQGNCHSSTCESGPYIHFFKVVDVQLRRDSISDHCCRESHCNHSDIFKKSPSPGRIASSRPAFLFRLTYHGKRKVYIYLLCSGVCNGPRAMRDRICLNTAKEYEIPFVRAVLVDQSMKFENA